MRVLTRSRKPEADARGRARVTKYPGAGPRPGVALGVGVLAISLLSGCSDSGSPEFCAQYEDLSAAAEDLRAKDPGTEVEELQAAADDVRAELDEFQDVADGPLDDAMTRLRASVDEARQAAAGAGAQARDEAQPQVEAAMNRVQEAWTVVESLAETRCPAS
ncbi:MAG: hypothetical protein WCA30_15375 [Dermatophilaceae bacterium]